MKTQTRQKIYLAKGGKVTGPLDARAYEDLRSSGRILDYSWIWNARSDRWDPLDPAPAPIREVSQSSSHSAAATRGSGGIHLPVDVIQAVCHDFRNAIAGKLDSVTEFGCELLSEHQASEPGLVENTRVSLNLLHPTSGKSVNVQALLASVRRSTEGSWTYQLSWDQCPSL